MVRGYFRWAEAGYIFAWHCGFFWRQGGNAQSSPLYLCSLDLRCVLGILLLQKQSRYAGVPGEEGSVSLLVKKISFGR